MIWRARPAQPPAGREPGWPAPPGPRIIGYLASWGVRPKGIRIADLPGDQLTHIIYAFARITEDGRFALGDPCIDVGQCGAAPGAPLPSTALFATPLLGLLLGTRPSRKSAHLP